MKKIMALILLGAALAFTAVSCSSSSGGGSSSGSGTGTGTESGSGTGTGSGTKKDGKYKVKYNNEVLISFDSADELEEEVLQYLDEGDDYTKDGDTYTLTEAGYELYKEFADDDDNGGTTGGNGGSTGGTTGGNGGTTGGNGGSTGGTTGGNGGTTGGHEGEHTGGNGEHEGEHTGGTGTGTGTGGNTSQPTLDSTVTYNIVCGGIPVASYNGAILSAMAEEAELTYGTDYTISGSTITLTQSGMAKLEALEGNNGGNHTGHEGETGGQGGNEVPGGNGGAGAGTVTTYTIVYNGQTVASNIPAASMPTMAASIGVTEGTDYTISGNTVTLTESGFNKYMAYTQGAGGSHSGAGAGAVTTYTIVYGNLTLVPSVPADYMPTMAASIGVTEGTDYTISGNTVTLTASGYAKYVAYAQGAGGSHTETGTYYTLVYNGQTLIPNMSDEDISDMAEDLQAIEGTDYTISGNTVTLTDAGYAKYEAYMSLFPSDM